MSDSSRPKDLRLVKPAEQIERAQLDEATDALRAVLDPAPLGEADHEALLALTLGEDVSAIGPGEKAEAEALRAALEGSAQHPLADLARTLRTLAAAEDAVLASADHEALLSISLGEAAQVDEEERAEADKLRQALERQLVQGPALDGPSHPLATLATSLRAAAGRLGDLDELGHERIVRRALRTASDRVASSGRVAVVAAIVALAAAVALFVGSFRWLETLGGEVASGGPGAGALAPAQLVVSRSTQELFDPLSPFPAKGGESERMGRIVTARASDLRANRFAAWGVR